MLTLIRKNLLLNSVVIYLLITTTEILTFWKRTPDFDDTEGNFIVSLIGNLIFFYALVYLYKKRDSVYNVVKSQKLLISLLFLFILSSLWSDLPFVTLKRSLKLFILYTLVLAMSVSDSKYIIKNSMSYYLKICTILSVLFMVFLPEFGWMLYEGKNVPKGIFIHKNGFGFFMALSSIWFFYESIVNQQSRKTNIAFFFICFSGLLISKSSTSLIGFLVSSITLIILLFLKRRKELLRLIAIIIAICVINFGMLLKAFEFIPDNFLLSVLHKDVTLTGRTDIWEPLIAVRVSDRLLLGSGYNTFFNEYRDTRLFNFLPWAANNAHNEFLQIFLDNGLVGLLIVVALFFTLLVGILRSKNIKCMCICLLLLVFSISEAGIFKPFCAFFSLLIISFQVTKKEDII